MIGTPWWPDTKLPPGYWYGPLGALLSFPGLRSGDVGQEDNSSWVATTKTGLSGTRVEVSRSQLRSWPVSIPSLSPAEAGLVEEVIDGVLGLDPCHWVPLWTAQQNLLTKRAARFMPGSGWTGQTITAAGPRELGDSTGGWPTSGLVLGPERAYSPVVPVLPGQPVTASCYIRGLATGTPRAELRFVNAAGAELDLATVVRGNTVGTAGLTRSSASVDAAPADAAGAQMSVLAAAAVAAPTISWTPAPAERAVGTGCPAAVAHSLTRSRRRWTNNGPRVDVGFTVQEVSR